MRTLLIAGAAFCVLALSHTAPSQAQVTIRTPGLDIEAGPQAYWAQRHDDAQWRRREEVREAQNARTDWLRDHCVRDWDGHAYCR